jgi:hypothetical protein
MGLAGAELNGRGQKSYIKCCKEFILSEMPEQK